MRVVPLASGERLALRVFGEGDAVLLLHGFPGSSHDWDEVAVRLAATSRVVVPDLIGFGGSSRPPDPERLWADAQAEALAAALDVLEVDQAALVGHDFGGPVALAFLRRHPRRVTHLALAATNAFPDTPIPFPLSTVTWPLVGGLAARFLFSGPALRLMSGRRQARSEVASVRTIFSTSLRNLERLYAPLAELLPRIDVPTLVLWGDHDPFFPLEQGHRTAAAIPGARLVALEGAGHFLPAERPAELAREIAALVRGSLVSA